MPSPDRQNGPLRFYQVGDQITLNCNHPEAEMEGSNRITCTHGGTWDQEPPICHQLPCSKIPRYFMKICMSHCLRSLIWIKKIFLHRDCYCSQIYSKPD